MNIYVDANWNGTDAAPEGYDAIYKTIAEAVTAVSEANKVAGKTDIGATITVASGTYSDNISTTVYITRTGNCYHRSGCSHAKTPTSYMSISSARSKGYRACYYCF